MEEKLKEEHRLRVHEHKLRIEAEEKLHLLLREREKEHAEQQRRQRLQHREKARETAQLLDKARGAECTHGQRAASGGVATGASAAGQGIGGAS